MYKIIFQKAADIKIIFFNQETPKKTRWHSRRKIENTVVRSFRQLTGDFDKMLRNRSLEKIKNVVERFSRKCEKVQKAYHKTSFPLQPLILKSSHNDINRSIFFLKSLFKARKAPLKMLFLSENIWSQFHFDSADALIDFNFIQRKLLNFLVHDTRNSFKNHASMKQREDTSFVKYPLDKRSWVAFCLFAHDLIIHLSIYNRSVERMMEIKRKSVFCI